MSKRTRALIRAIVAIIGLILVIYFHSNTGMKELGMMLAGLALMLWALYDYNRAFQ